MKKDPDRVIPLRGPIRGQRDSYVNYSKALLSRVRILSLNYPNPNGGPGIDPKQAVDQITI
jgi:hypothetical protein